MLKKLQANFKLKNLIAVLLTPILLLGFFVGSANAEGAGHIVISAVQITEGEGKTDHDFIEIYNPTKRDINLKGFRLVKRTKTGTSDTSIKSWIDDAIIKAHSWRLWASSGDETYILGNSADDRTVATISPDNGIAIRFGAEDTGEIIDSAAWGEAENIFKEGVAAPALGISESLVRKPGISSEGNGEDANNNAGDFIVVINFIPHNSQSAAEPAIENSVTAVPTPTVSPNLSPEASSSPAASVSSSRLILLVAEAGADKEAVIGENLDFDGSDSYDPAGEKLVLTWDFGDKTGVKGLNAAHSYSAVGEYSVILKADNGESVSEDILKVKITMPEFSDKIILSEILPNPIGVDKDGEWIELYNSGDKKVNLKGWILASGAKTASKQYIFSGDNFIEAKSYLVIKRSASGLVLTNENGKVSLSWSADKIMSEVAYGSAKEGKSFAFVNNVWQWADAPTPSKANLVKASVVTVSKEKESVVSQASAAKNTVNQAVFNEEEIFGEEDLAAEDSAIDSVLAKSAVWQTGNNFSAEDFLDRLILEKVDKAILKAKTGATAPSEKILALADNSLENGVSETGKESVCKDFYAENEKNTADERNDIRNNPWFYGDIALSVLSLFLVWRYQEIRKRVK